MADRKSKDMKARPRGADQAESKAPVTKPVAPPTAAEAKKAEPVKAPLAASKPAPKAPPADVETAVSPIAAAAAVAKKAEPVISAAEPPSKAKQAEPSKPKQAEPTAPSTPQKQAPVEAAAQTIKKGSTMINERINEQTNEAVKSGKAAAEQVQNLFGDVNQRAKGAMERNARFVEEFADLARGNVEAMVASSKAAAKGIETITQEVADFSRRSFEEATTAFRGFAEAKSPTDFFRMQGDYARTAFDSAVAETARVSETVIKLAGEVAEPMTSRYSVAAERVKNIAA